MDATVKGTLTIMKGEGDGDARFCNEGVVKATGSQGNALLLDASLDVITDSCSTCEEPRWGSVGEVGAVLCFDREATSLKGDFRIGGVLKLWQDVATGGSLLLESGGQISPFGGASFSAGANCPASACQIQGVVSSPLSCQ